MAVIDQYKQIQDNLTVQKQARDMGYTVDRANKTIGVDPLKPITEEQRTELTAKGWKVIDQQPAPTTTPSPQPVVPTAPTTPTAPTAPAPVEKQVESTQIKTQTTPTATVEKDILSPNVTGMGTLTPEQQKLQTNAINKLNSNLSIYSTGKSLYDAVQGGSILPGTKEFTDLTTRNPRVLEEYNLIKAEKEKTDTIKTLGQAIVGETITPKPSNALEQLVSFFTKSMDTDVASEYQNTVINNPAYQNSIQTLNGINQQIADNNNNITKLREDVRKKYSAGTPESLIASAIAREARPLIEQGQYLSQLQQNAQAEMTRIFEENKDVFDMKQEERKQKNQRMIELYGTLRDEEIRQEDFARADKKLADEIARAEKTDKAKVAQLEQERLDNVKEAIAKLGVTPVGETYDELLGEYANAVKNQPKEDKITTGLKPGDYYIQDGQIKQVPEGSNFVGGGDLRQYASQFPREASLKNNNPAGITWNDSFANRLQQAGIAFEKGTNRPANEGGSYFSFPTIEEGFKAYDLLWSSPSYTNLTLGQALNRWNTGSTEKGYGNQISAEVKINAGTKVSELSPEQLRSVQMAQLKRESPGMYRILGQQQAQKSDPYLQAFNVLAFDKPTLQKQEQKVLQDLIQGGKPEQVKTKLENLASNNIEGAPEKTAYQQTRTLVSSLEKVRQTLDNLKAKGVNTGLLKGKYEDIANKFGKVGDPEIAKLGVTLRDQLDALRRARSGAALTEFEEKFYDSIFPSAGKSYDLNVAGLDGLLDSRRALKNSYLQNAYGDDLFNTIWGEKQQTPAPTGKKNIFQQSQTQTSTVNPDTIWQ